jgi:hypothetical protein
MELRRLARKMVGVLKENRPNREAEDEEIEVENEITAFAHRVLKAAAKQEW